MVDRTVIPPATVIFVMGVAVARIPASLAGEERCKLCGNGSDEYQEKAILMDNSLISNDSIFKISSGTELATMRKQRQPRPKPTHSTLSPMNAATLLCPENFPSRFSFFANHSSNSDRSGFFASPGPRRTQAASEPRAKAPNRPAQPEPIDAACLAELFAHKREEKAPEGFMQDFVAEFARRNYGVGR